MTLVATLNFASLYIYLRKVSVQLSTSQILFQSARKLLAWARESFKVEYLPSKNSCFDLDCEYPAGRIHRRAIALCNEFNYRKFIIPTSQTC